MPTVAQAYVQLIPTTEGIGGQISSALEGPAASAGDSAGSKFGAGFKGKVTSGLKVAGVAVAGFAAAGGAALAKGIKDVSQYGDHVDKMSQKIGFSSEGFQKWDYVLKSAGTSIDSMGPVMKKLSSAAVENSDAFQQLGISQEEVANMSQEELFGKTIEALSGMEEGAERTALASKLLGKGATELGPLLNEGTDAIKEQMDAADKYGMVMSDDAVKASADFVNAQTTLSMSMKGLQTRMIGQFLPAVTDITTGLAKMASGDVSGGLESIKAGISSFIDSISSYIPQMLEMGKNMLFSLISGITTALPELAKKGADMLLNLSNGIGGGESDFLLKAGELIVNFGAALIKAAAILIPAAGKALIGFILNTDWIGTGKKAVTAVLNGFKAIWPSIVSYVNQMVGKIMTKLGFAGLGTKVRNVFNNVKKAITEPIDKAKELVDTAVGKIKSIFPISMGKIFSGIKLPHFNISGGEAPWGIGGMGTRPSVSIDWYARGGIMTKPTLFGGGEAGAEAILPLAPFYDYMDNFADSIVNGLSTVAAGAGAGGGDIYVTMYAYPGGPQMDQAVVRSYDRGKRKGLK